MQVRDDAIRGNMVSRKRILEEFPKACQLCARRLARNNEALIYSVGYHQGIAKVVMRQFGCSFPYNDYVLDSSTTYDPSSDQAK
jgi:hypothetical protein